MGRYRNDQAADADRNGWQADARALRLAPDMKLIFLVLAIGAPALAATPAHADPCVSAPMNPDSNFQFPHFELDLGDGVRLDRARLPAGTAIVVCRRASLIPQPDDLRVLMEWNVAFGISEDRGPRSLWISATAGRLEITVDNGELSVAEQAAIDAWVAAAQARFSAALAASVH
jgi:hypothetical protein